MEQKYKLIIPEPCQENWDKMIPNRNNSFLHPKINYSKMFFLFLFLATEVIFLGCSDKKNDKKKEIDSVKIISDTSKTRNTIVKTSIKNDSNEDISASSKVDQTKFVKPKENDDLKSEKTSSAKNNTSKAAIQATSTGEVVSETNAEFPGGIDRFYTFFGKEYKKPENSETANLKIRLSFAVEKNGSATYLQSDPPVDNLVEKEIIRVLSVSPKWEPGETNGKKAKRLYSLPIVLP